MGYILKNDSWLRAKIAIERERIEDKSSLQEILLHKKELEIYDKVLEHAETGIAHGELASEIKIDRKNLRPYMRRLIKKNLVRREDGIQGKYYPVTKYTRERPIAADIWGKQFLSKVLHYGEINLDGEFVINSPYTDIKSIDVLEHALFNFSNIIGGFITCTLIQAMNPSNNITRNVQDDREKDLNVRIWAEDAISSILSYILPWFKWYASLYLRSLDRKVPTTDDDIEAAIEPTVDYQTKRPLYTLNKEIIAELNNALRNVYPNLSRELENIRTELPKLVIQGIDHREHMARKHKIQKKCNHTFETLPDKNPLAYSEVQRCTKCDKIKNNFKIIELK
jgi:predicted DNA-binding transcriptional regulator